MDTLNAILTSLTGIQTALIALGASIVVFIVGKAIYDAYTGGEGYQYPDASDEADFVAIENCPDPCWEDEEWETIGNSEDAMDFHPDDESGAG